MLRRSPSYVVLAVILLGAGWGRYAAAQDVNEEVPLYLSNEETTIRSIRFEFVDAERYPPQFEPEQLKLQIATRAPGFGDRLKKNLRLDGLNAFRLDPIELQKDVVRLRQFYQQNGYLRAYVHYGESDLDTESNTIGLVFSIRQGPFIFIEDVVFFDPNSPDSLGYLADVDAFDAAMRQRWIAFRDRTGFRVGDRFTIFELARIQDQALNWLKDQGYAFATLDTRTEIDSTNSAANIRFYVDPGPLTYFDDVVVRDNERVSRNVVLRELPFKKGDIFSNQKLIAGQRELFGLNLFQIAQVEIPEAVENPDSLQQLRDSTVTVRFNLRESRLRYFTAETGYDQKEGISLNGQWSHRNFLGGARTLSVRGEIESGLRLRTGLLTSDEAATEASRLFRGSVALRQPYLFTNGLSGIVEPFIQFERDTQLRDTDLFAQINRRELGVNTTLIYELRPFRTVSLRYGLSRATQFADVREDTTARDAYSKSIITLNGTFGWVNNFLNPRRGGLVRPFIEQGGGLERLFGLGASGVEYLKTGVEVVGYIPITKKISVGTRLAGGRLWPLNESNAAVPLYVSGTEPPRSFDPLFVAPFEDRFDPIRFYAGGSNDVRGWDFGLIGPKINRTEIRRDDAGMPLFDDRNVPLTENEQYEPIGGLARLVGNVEIRFPFPGLGNAWRAAAFLDFGQVSGKRDETQDCSPPFFNDEALTESAEPQCGFSDSGTIALALDKFKYGVGAGIRYETPIGYLRLDVAYKLNPDDLDLQTPRNAFLSNQGFAEPDRSFLNHLNIHLSIGQAF